MSPKISSEEWLAELDRVMELSNQFTPIVDDRGFTCNELAARIGRSPRASKDRILTLVKDGVIKHVGYRSGKNPAKVYEMVGEK